MKRKKKIKNIRFRPELFWDVNPKTIDPEKHTRYIIERILDYGTFYEMRWLTRRYSRQTIRRVMALPRVQLHAKSKSLWSLVFQKR